jgi:hypothetical protein
VLRERAREKERERERERKKGRKREREREREYGGGESSAAGVSHLVAYQVQARHALHIFRGLVSE